VSAGALVSEQQPARITTRPSSIQEATLDLLWIADRVACFAGPKHAPLYRAVLAVAGPPEAFAGSEHAERALAGYAAVLNGLEHPLQLLARTEEMDVATYAGRWDNAASRLPPPLAALAQEHAGWARRHLPPLGLLERRLYLVIPAEQRAPPARSLVNQLRQRARRHRSTQSDQAGALSALSERCDRLQHLLKSAGIRSARLDDIGLARLYRACWGHALGGERRFDRDVVAFFAAAGDSAPARTT
jgi:hypothetical protein